MSSSEKIDRVIINLKVISNIKEGERLTVRGGNFSVQSVGWFQGVSRWTNGDTRWGNLEDIKNVVDDAVRILGSYMTFVNQGSRSTTTQDDKTAVYPVPPLGSTLSYVDNVADELEAAATGLENLKKTYASDSRMVANLDVQTQKMKAEVATARALIGQYDASSTTTTASPALKGGKNKTVIAPSQTTQVQAKPKPSLPQTDTTASIQ